MYQRLFRPIFFRLDPEQAHTLTLQLMRLAGTFPLMRQCVYRFLNTGNLDEKPVEAFGLRFANPVGLAAGYDKDGLAWQGLTALGFGHIEVGTVTPKAQPGNPKPRIFRIPAEKAVINRMGFPGLGAEFVARRLQGSKSLRNDIVLGVNIGKNKDTPNEAALADYLQLVKVFSPLADYLAINVSSPNTVGLRRLQARQSLEHLLKGIKETSLQLPDRVPILVKLAPDLDDRELDDALEAIIHTDMDGIIATNTTISRDGLLSPLRVETGGLSGAPLSQRSRNMVASIHKATTGAIPIIGVGGIMNGDDAARMIDAGAVLIQVYSGLVFAGPGLVNQILAGLSVQE